MHKFLTILLLAASVTIIGCTEHVYKSGPDRDSVFTYPTHKHIAECVKVVRNEN